MIFLHILSLLVGLTIAALLLGSALKTVVLPQEGYPRLSQADFALVHRLMVHPRQEARRGSALRSLYAPVALVSLPLVWMIVVAAGFMCIFWSSGSLTWQKAFEISVSSLTTLGFSEPPGTGRIFIAFIEATIGLGLVALLISYLPTIYSAYNSREKGIFMLSPMAGTPPNATGLLGSLHLTGAMKTPEFWRTQTDWIIDAEQTHTAFPILTYFPEAHANLSWVATVGALLDAAAVVVSATGTIGTKVLEEAEKGPLMTLVYGIPTIDRIARAASVPLVPAPTLVELTAHIANDPTPEISVSRQEYSTPWTRSGTGSTSRKGSTPSRGGTGSPGCARPTTGRCAPWPASPTPTGTVDHGPAGRRRPPPLLAPAAAPGGLDRHGAPQDSEARSGLAALGQDLEVAEAAGLLLGHGHRDRVAVEVGDGSLDVLEQEEGQVAATPCRTRMRWTEMSDTEPVSG